MLRLDGRCAIVTGAANGIGKATAKKLSELGGKVVACDVDDNGLEIVLKEIEKAGGQAITIKCDVGNLDDIRSVIEKTIERFERIDILVNNAGIGGIGKTILELEYEEWNRMIHIDLASAFMFCKEILPYMIKQEYGKIVNVSSEAALKGSDGATSYSAAKAGLIGLTKSIALEVAKYRINVNCLAPGLTNTNMSRKRGLEQHIPLIIWPRIGTPEDMANAIAFLVSDEAEYLTGQVLSPNGGSWM